MLAGLLLLADSRLPSGGHVHSGGVEALVDRGLITSVTDLAEFLDARIRTAGLCAASVAAASATLAATPGPVAGTGAGEARCWRRWDSAVDVRTPSPALRSVSRAQGEALLRTASGAWPGSRALGELAVLRRPHQPLVLGASVAAAARPVGRVPAGPDRERTAEQAAVLAVHHLVGGAASAAVRLLGLDPLRVASVQAGLAELVDRTSAEAARLGMLAATTDDPELLPADATPLPEILAELHHHSEVTLFAS